MEAKWKPSGSRSRFVTTFECFHVFLLVERKEVLEYLLLVQYDAGTASTIGIVSNIDGVVPSSFELISILLNVFYKV